jgi:hypothetical protein
LLSSFLFVSISFFPWLSLTTCIFSHVFISFAIFFSFFGYASITIPITGFITLEKKFFIASSQFGRNTPDSLPFLIAAAGLVHLFSSNLISCFTSVK